MNTHQKQTIEFRGTLRPLYRELLNNPPTGITYRVYDPRYSVIARRFWSKTWIPGKIARHVYWRARYNSWFDRTLLHLSNYWDYSPIRMRRKFVADTENVGTFISKWDFEELKSPTIRKTIEDSIRSKYCCKIMPLTQAAQKTMEAAFNTHDVEQKIEVVYPAIRASPRAAPSDDHALRILFVGTNFLIKGGRELLEAFRIIRKRYDVALEIVSQEAYNTIKPEEGVKIYATISRQELLSTYFPNSSIFCLPTYADSFGFVLLEAMASALPVVSTTHFHIPEIVANEKTGLLIKTPISCWNSNFTYNYDWLNELKNNSYPEAVSELVEKLSILIDDKSMRIRMGEAGRREVTDGKFSITKRNRQLKGIYLKALES